MKKLIILRGLPGSGKSTKALELVNGEKAYIFSADAFFIDKETRQYRFEPRLLKMAHTYCYECLMEYMDPESQEPREPLVLDNTNTQKWEYQPYLDAAKKYGYEVEIVMIGNLVDIDLYASRNIHGVPRAAIERMAKRFEV